MRTIALLMIALLALAGCQQETGTPAPATAPPDAVTKAFAAAHPGIKSTGWEMEDGDVEIEYTANGVEVSEIYSPEGELVSTETRIDVATLPLVIREAVAADVPGGAIEAAERIDAQDGTQYEVEVRGTDGAHELLYSADGMSLGEETEDDDGTEEDDDEVKP